MGTTIEFPANGETMSGYLAEPPAGKANGRGLVVLQEWWGLVPHIKDVADRFAAEGYLVLAPDLWHGERTTNPDEAGRLFMALNVPRVEKDLRGAITALAGRGATGRIGVVGFCMGGQLALYAATTSTDRVGAVVDFYGVHPNVHPDFDKLACPVLGLFGEEDSSVSPEVVHKLADAIREKGGAITTAIYPGAGHAFFNDARPEAYNAAAAADAWKKTLAFLGDNLQA
jgi:carboxymethylenebutenolidase